MLARVTLVTHKGSMKAWSRSAVSEFTVSPFELAEPTTFDTAFIASS